MIKLENVTKAYKGEHVALRDASVDIAKGEFVFLVGPSGSGKSTFLRLLNREERPEKGKIFVAGKDIGRAARPQGAGPAPQRRLRSSRTSSCCPSKTVYENVAFALEAIGRPRRRDQGSGAPDPRPGRVWARRPRTCPTSSPAASSSGCRSPRAFVNRPLILLADEPTGNLDPATSVGIMKLLDRINRTGTTVVMATHDRGIVDTMRRRVIELDNGRIVRDQVRGVYE